MLWKTFSETCKAQCKAAARLSQEDKQGRNAQRREHLKQACRDFFTADVEATAVRPLASACGLIPGTANYMHESEDDLCTLAGSDPNSWLRPAYEQVGDQRFVRGQYRMPFPVNGPRSKYAALFDPNPCFDALRLAFVEEPQPCGSRKAIQGNLRCSMCPSACRTRLETFLEAIVEFESGARAVGEAPPGFHERLWSSYQRVLRSHGYYLSMDELVIVARALNINVAIVMKQPDNDTYVLRAQHMCNMGPCVLLLLTGNPMQRAACTRITNLSFLRGIWGQRPQGTLERNQHPRWRECRWWKWHSHGICADGADHRRWRNQCTRTNADACS